jgi:hypothetical protein
MDGIGLLGSSCDQVTGHPALRRVGRNGASADLNNGASDAWSCAGAVDGHPQCSVIVEVGLADTVVDCREKCCCAQLGGVALLISEDRDLCSTESDEGRKCNDILHGVDLVDWFVGMYCPVD